MILINNLLCYAEDIRSLENLALKKYNLSEDTLMERAGDSVMVYLTKFYPHVRRISVYCGGGNNAGDGYVLARLAHQKGLMVRVNQCSPIEKLPPPAYRAAKTAISAGVICQTISQSEGLDHNPELIVDALLGIGLKGEVRSPLKEVIDEINNNCLPIIAIDIPSGLNSDTGQVMGTAVKAKLTVTFLAYKSGLVTCEGPDHCGKIICNDLGLKAYFSIPYFTGYYCESDLPPVVLSPRLKNSHKAQFGHVLVLGGNYGMPGAVVLTASAALRVGAGLVTIATKSDHAKRVLDSLPEAMVYGISDKNTLLSLLDKATWCIIGPGLGEDEWAESMFQIVLDSDLPLLVDASALRLLRRKGSYRKNWILTPHPGEAAYLLDCSTAQIQGDRIKSAIALQERYGGNVVLKGVGSVIRTGNQVNYICQTGNPGMATAGTGDVLSGIIGGLAAQQLSFSEAAILGVWMHGRAGDIVSRLQGERGVIASDLINELPHVLNRVRNNECK